jgi:hypothetical protein
MNARKPFTTIAALLFLVMAAVHAYRLATGLEISIHGHPVSMAVSWIAIAVTVFLGVMLLRESKR